MAHISVGSVAVRIPPAIVFARNILKYREELHICGQCSLRKLAPLSGFEIQGAPNGVFRGQKTGEGSNAKNGGFLDAARAKKKNNKKIVRVSKKTCIFDFVNKKKTDVKKRFTAKKNKPFGDLPGPHALSD